MTGFAPILFGLIWAIAIVCFSNPIAHALGLVDHPGAQAHKAHSRPTPLVGGLALIPPTIATLLPGTGGLYAGTVSELWAIALATGGSFLIGLCDDRRHIPAAKRLALSAAVFAAAMILCPSLIVSAVTINYFGWKIALGWLAAPFTLICLLAFQNAVNMADGRNGLVTGIAIIWLAALLTYGPHPSNLAILSMLCAMLVVWIANLNGRLFLGDAGSYGIGAFIGLVVIWHHHSNVGMHTTQVVTLLLIPVLDMARLFAFRLMTGRHPFSPDHSHLHHYLDGALGWKRGRLIYYAIVGLPIIALRANLLPGIFCVGLGVALYAITLVTCSSRLAERSGALHRMRFETAPRL